MPKIARELGPLDIKRAQHPRDRDRSVRLQVGGVSGLLLQIAPSGAKSWVLRTMAGVKRREIGLGPYPEIGLAQAREKAREVKAQIAEGIDPVESRKAARAALIAAQRRGLTFAEACQKWIEAREAEMPIKRQKYVTNAFARYAEPHIGDMLVQDIEPQDVLRVLQPIWTGKNFTATKLRQRIESVLMWSTVNGHRTGPNPAAWAGNLKELLPAPSKVAQVEHLPAVALDDLPRWFEALRQRDGFGSRALEFLTLTATRSGEVRGARWDEIDLDAALWIVPAVRMKMGREHRVPLSPDAVALLKALPRMAGTPYVFPAIRGGQLSDATLSATMKRIHAADLDAGGAGFVDRVSKRPAVPHGLRSTFRDWVADRTDFSGDMAEIALAHKVGSAVEAAYRRGHMVEKRRAMMAAWADFVTGREAVVIDFKARA